MSTRAQRAADRIRQQVPITQVLASLGYGVRGDDREQQFRCDLHGSGHDDKPSARVYPHTNSWYCFGCGIARDAIATLSAKQGVSFWVAVHTLERAFGLDPLPIDDTEEDSSLKALNDLHTSLDSRVTFGDEEQRVKRLLDVKTSDRDLPLMELLLLWEEYDKIVFHVRGDHTKGSVWSEAKGAKALVDLRLRIMAGRVTVEVPKVSS